MRAGWCNNLGYFNTKTARHVTDFRWWEKGGFARRRLRWRRSWCPGLGAAARLAKVYNHRNENLEARSDYYHHLPTPFYKGRRRVRTGSSREKQTPSPMPSNSPLTCAIV